MVQQWVAQSTDVQRGSRVGVAEYLGQLDGLVYGSNPGAERNDDVSEVSIRAECCFMDISDIRLIGLNARPRPFKSVIFTERR